MGELRSLDNHLTACEYALLRCTNKCTNNTEEVYVLRHDMDNHLKNTCPNRQYQCPHCKDTGQSDTHVRSSRSPVPMLGAMIQYLAVNSQITKQNVCSRRYHANMQELAVRKNCFVKTYRSTKMTTCSTFSWPWRLLTQ